LASFGSRHGGVLEFKIVRVLLITAVHVLMVSEVQLMSISLVNDELVLKRLLHVGVEFILLAHVKATLRSLIEITTVCILYV